MTLPHGAELIRKFLDVSTAHLPRETVDMIEAGTFPKVTLMQGEYGWLFSVPDAADIPDMSKDWPCESFRLVIQRASLLGAEFVLFDRDAYVIEDLPVFDW